MSYGDWAASQKTDAQNAADKAAADAAAAKAQQDAANGVYNGANANSTGGSSNLANGGLVDQVGGWLHDTFGKADDVKVGDPDWSTATYGGTPEHSAANLATVYGKGDEGAAADVQTGVGINSKAQGTAWNAYGTGSGLNNAGQANVAGGTGMQQQQYNNIGNWLSQGPGPSVAQAQLAQANQQNIGNAMALAASGRGAGSNAAAQQAAIAGGLNAGQQTAQQSSVLRAQEAQNWRSQQMQGMGMQSDIGANIASTGANQQQLGLGYNQFGGSMQQSGNASLLSAMGQGQQNQQSFYNMGQQQLANETQARTALEQARLTADEKAQEANQDSTYKHQGSIGGMLSAAAGALAACCHPDTLIAAEFGERRIEELRPGERVWTLDRGEKKLVEILLTSQRAVKDHRMTILTTEDGCKLTVSGTHPDSGGAPVASLHVGEVIGGKRIASITSEPYELRTTYDILPDSSTGAYWANGILIGSTLWIYQA
jgi:hypothetical protein